MRRRLQQANKFLEGALLMGLILKGTSFASTFLSGLVGPFLSFFSRALCSVRQCTSRCQARL